MTLTGPNRLRAVRAAQEILEQFSVSVLPVDVDAIAAELGISVVSEQLPLDIYGATAHDGVRSRVLISTTCFSPGHRRFTLAHEIGHFCIGGHAEHLFSRGKGLHHSGGAIGCRRDPIEVEADAFAAELLMPNTLTTAAAAAEGVGVAMIRTVATAADVSVTAAAIRVSELVPDPFAVVLTRRANIEWAFFSSGMREHAWARRSFKNTSAPTDSVSMRVAKSLTKFAVSGVETSMIQLADWFAGAPGVWAAEEALGLGDYGRVLTVIIPEKLPTADQAEHARRKRMQSSGDWRDALRSYSWDDPDAPE